VFSHDIFSYPLWLFRFQFQFPLVCLSGSYFSVLSSPSFSWSNFREGTFYIKVHFHTCSWCSFFIVGLTVWRCTGW
jgi:hypothetical protein